MAKLSNVATRIKGADKISAGFIEFLKNYGVIGLAIAVIIGAAVGKLVNALVDDIIMPIVTFFIPGGAWEEATISLGSIVLRVGHFVGAVIDFVIIALVVYLIAKWILKEEKVAKK